METKQIEVPLFIMSLADVSLLCQLAREIISLECLKKVLLNSWEACSLRG